jgi:hypothetical protein
MPWQNIATILYAGHSFKFTFDQITNSGLLRQKILLPKLLQFLQRACMFFFFGVWGTKELFVCLSSGKVICMA